MTGEIVKIDKQSGQVSRSTHGETKIVGAPDRHGKTEIVDRTTPQEQPPMEVVQHHEDVLESDAGLRLPAPKEDDPQVRIRTMTDEQRKAWEAAKRDDA